MHITEIYSKYKLLPILQDHLFRVAYVGNLIAMNMTTSVDIDSITKACLLHDLGNIIKSNLTLFPEALQPQGLEYWKGIKKEFIEIYGDDEVAATHLILEELNVTQKVKELVKSFGTRNVVNVIESNDLERMIVNYSDHRVSPQKITSLKDRITDQHNRFKKLDLPKDQVDQLIKTRKKKDKAKYKLEKLIFNKCEIKPNNVSDFPIQKIKKRFINIEF